MTVQGAKAPLTLTAEVLPVIPGVHMVEMTRATGDINDFYQLYALLSKAVIPALVKAASSRERQPGGQPGASSSDQQPASLQGEASAAGSREGASFDFQKERASLELGTPRHSDSSDDIGGLECLPAEASVTRRLAAQTGQPGATARPLGDEVGSIALPVGQTSLLETGAAS